jgi:hypothetical protein
MIKRPFVKSFIKIVSYITIINSLVGIYFTYKFYVPVRFYSLYDTRYIESKNVYIYRFIFSFLTICIYGGNFLLLKQPIEKNRIFILLYSLAGLAGIIAFFIIRNYAKSNFLADINRGMRIFCIGLLINAFIFYLYEKEQRNLKVPA